MTHSNNDGEDLFKLILSFFWMTCLFVLSAAALAADKHEADYVREHCDGLIEFNLEDRSRVDCLTGTHAIEYDYARKWAESIGQSIFYSRMTGKAPAVVLIAGEGDEKYIKRFRVATEGNGLKIQLTVIPK